MSKIKINPALVQKAYKDANDETKRLIEANVNMFEGTTTEQFVVDMMKEFQHCRWYDILREAFPELDFIRDNSINVLNVNITQMIEPQTSGEFARQAYKLNNLCDWSIVHAASGGLLLVPLKKK